MAEDHIKWFSDWINLEEVDHGDVQMRLFVESLAGERKKWFRNLQPISINDFPQFERAFLARWEDKRNPLQILSQYNSLKRVPKESISYFSARFLKTYESIPANFKPPPRAAQLHYSEAFDGDFMLDLRERRYPTLENMMAGTIEVEVNVMASKKSK